MTTEFTVVHQCQPDDHSCNQTCLAMVLGVPVADVLAVFPGDGMSSREMYVALDRCHLLWDALQFGTFVVDGLYLINVPSLNIEAGGHRVLMDWRGCWDESRLHDPNRGRPGKRFYSTGDDGAPLKWWTGAIIVRPGGQLPTR